MPFPHLRTTDIRDRVDSCRQVLDALDVPPTTSIKISCWSVCPPSEHDCLPSSHLCRHPKNADSTKSGTNSPNSSGGPRAYPLAPAPRIPGAELAAVAVMTSDDAGPALLPELVSLALAGVNFVRANEAAWKTFLSAMAKRQASPA